MEEPSTTEPYQLGDITTSDITVLLKNQDARREQFHCHSPVLMKKSKFFADQLSNHQSHNPLEVSCPSLDFDHYIKLLKLLYISEETISDSLDTVKCALGILRASLSLNCEAVTLGCINYLEAMPWDEKEEEEILKLIPSLGPKATPILARFHAADVNATKNVFISAVRFATTVDESFPAFTDELRVSAQEQVDYMLAEDKDTPLIAVDEDVKAEAKAGLSKMLSRFTTELSYLASDLNAAEQRVLQSISDLDWMCNILPKMDLMTDFVAEFAQISERVLDVVQDGKFSACLWGVKLRLIELVGKALDAIGFGYVVLPVACRVRFLKTWLPYLRRMKPILDSKALENEGFSCKMDDDLCQNIEGAIVSLVLALPASDQAKILGEWMERTEQLRFPDLSEAFEVWCYRTKAAKRRLMVGFNGVESNGGSGGLDEISKENFVSFE